MPKPRAIASLYTRRLVISISPLGALILCIPAAFAIWRDLIPLATSITVICAVLSLATVASARYHLKHLRYDITKHFSSMMHDSEPATINTINLKERKKSAQPGFPSVSEFPK